MSIPRTHAPSPHGLSSVLSGTSHSMARFSSYPGVHSVHPKAIPLCSFPSLRAALPLVADLHDASHYQIQIFLSFTQNLPLILSGTKMDCAGCHAMYTFVRNSAGANPSYTICRPSHRLLKLDDFCCQNVIFPTPQVEATQAVPVNPTIFFCFRYHDLCFI